MMTELFKTKKGVVIIAMIYTLLWGTAYPLVKLCMDGFEITDDMSKALVAGIRFTASGMGIIVFSFFKGRQSITLEKKELPSIFLYGILGTSVQYAATFIAISNIDASKSAIFDQLGVFIVVIFGGLFLKNDRLTLLKVVGCIIGFAGVAATSTERFTFVFTLDGEGMMTLAALCQTAAYFIAIFSANKIPATKLVGFGQLFGGILLTAFALISGGRINTVNAKAILCLTALAVISAVAYVLSLVPLKYFPASEISVFNLFISIFGVIMSGIVLHENIFRLNYLVAIILICAGVFAVNYNKKTK